MVFGIWNLFRKDKKLFTFICTATLLYEVYFGIYLRGYSPLRYLNPLLPMAMLVFSTGINYIITQRRRLVPVLIIFAGILLYNYFDIWQALSLGKTHIQEARAYIEKNIPDLTTICITSRNYIPQLNMTRESYYRLSEVLPEDKKAQRPELDIDTRVNYDNSFKEFRIESLAGKPQYNIIEWDEGIKTKLDALNFLKKDNVSYIISRSALTINGKKIEDTKIASLVKKFEPRSRRIYKAVYGDVDLFLYKVN
jgi:hypothetical protein